MKKQTRRDRFLGKIEEVTPWAALVSAIGQCYLKGEGRGDRAFCIVADICRRSATDALTPSKPLAHQVVCVANQTR